MYRSQVRLPPLALCYLIQNERFGLRDWTQSVWDKCHELQVAEVQGFRGDRLTLEEGEPGGGRVFL